MAVVLLMRGVFWNPVQRRLRLVWRLVGFYALSSVATVLFGMGLSAIRTSMPWLGFPLGYVVQAAALMLATLLATWLLDRRRWTDLGFHLRATWWADLGFGLFLGAILMLLIFLVQWAAGWIAIVGTFRTSGSQESFPLQLVQPVAVFLFVGVWEEVQMRGYLLHNLAEGLNLRWLGPHLALVLAWLLSSIVFGLAHAANPNASSVSTLQLMLGGLLLGLGYVLTGELAISIGLHITWNFFQGVVFGLPVSGTDFSQTTFIAIRQLGPDLWTGGAFGPEAGLLGVLAELVGCFLILLWVRRRYGATALDLSLASYPRARDERGTSASAR